MKPVILIALLFLLFAACEKQKKTVLFDPWADYRKAYNLLSTRKDSAFFFFNQLADTTKNDEQAALSYYNMAEIQAEAGDHYGAQESLTLALKRLDGRHDRNTLAKVYNQLGMASSNLQDYSAALSYYQRAMEYADEPRFRPYILNNQGNAFQKKAAYTSALDSYQQAMQQQDKNSVDFARTLTNLATTKWLNDSSYNAAPELRAALAIRQRQQDAWGENSSYAHLSDFYAASRPDSALWYARKMLRVARRLGSPEDEMQALQKLTVLSRAQDAKPFFLRYQHLSDSIATARQAAKNQFALIRYDAEKNKAEALALQQANTKKEYQLGGVIALMIVGAGGFFWWYRKRRESQRREAESRVRETQLHYSRKIHDVVANGIYQVMNEIEYNETLDKVYLLDRLEEMYERSRDISYEKPRQPAASFTEDITAILQSFKGPDIKLGLTGNEPGLWQLVSEEIKTELKPVLQELMVNMRKHSQASQALLVFGCKDGQLQIAYRDNGIGMAKDSPLGNGLRNAVFRIRQLGGALTFGTPEGGGLLLQLQVPLT